MPTSLLFVRHGETTWNAARRWQGQADTPLTETGESQARDVARELAGLAERPWSRLVTSDLQRARRTAEAIAAELALSVELEPRLRERDVGSWSGLTHDEVEVRDPEAYRAFREGDPTIRMGGGESTLDLRARALDAIGDLHAGQPAHVIVVTHLGLIRSLVPGADVGNTGRLALDAEQLLASSALTLDTGSADGSTL